jgi:hypothetical protein
MKTVTLRTLLREPLKVKSWTRRGVPVQVTDNGNPLWLIHPAEEKSENDVNEINALLDEMLEEPVSPISLSQIVKEARR